MSPVALLAVSSSASLLLVVKLGASGRDSIASAELVIVTGVRSVCVDATVVVDRSNANVARRVVIPVSLFEVERNSAIAKKISLADCWLCHYWRVVSERNLGIRDAQIGQQVVFSVDSVRVVVGYHMGTSMESSAMDVDARVF